MRIASISYIYRWFYKTNVQNIANIFSNMIQGGQKFLRIPKKIKLFFLNAESICQATGKKKAVWSSDTM